MEKNTITLAGVQSHQNVSILKSFPTERDLLGLQKFLAQEEEIRIFVPDECNFGHLGTTINIMYRLIELGARQIRILYVEAEDPSALEKEKILDTYVDPWSKLQLLIPELPDHPITEFAIGETKVYLDSIDEWEQKYTKKVGLAITGGWDITEKEEADVLETWEMLNVRCFLILQPFRWLHAANLAAFEGNATLVDLTHPEELGEDYWDSVYYISRFQLTRAEEDRFRTSEPQKYTCVKALVTLCTAATPAIQMCPVYFSPDRTRVPGYGILLNLLIGIIQKNKTTAPQDKVPTVIVVMAPSGSKTDYWQPLRASLYEEDKDEAALYPQLHRYMVEEGIGQALRKVVLLESSAFTSATSMQQALAEVGSDGIIVVALGRVPQGVFNWLYASANLPGLFEGHGTASILLNLGKPYFRVHSIDEDEPDLYPLPASQNMPELTPDAFSAYCNACSNMLEADAEMWEQRFRQRREAPSRVLATFMNHALHQDDPVSNAFRRQGEGYHSQLQDKLVRALVYALHKMKIS